MRHVVVFWATVVLLVFGIESSLAQTQDDYLYGCPNSDMPIYLFNQGNDVWKTYTDTIRDVACDVDNYWRQVTNLTLPYRSPQLVTQEYNQYPYRKPFASSGSVIQDCPTELKSLDAPAYYCYEAEAIIIRENSNRDTYLKWKGSQLGHVWIMWMLAHEWAHHIQNMSIDLYSSEVQAECLAGAYIQYAMHKLTPTKIKLTQNDWTVSLRKLAEEASNKPVSKDPRSPWSLVTESQRHMALEQGYQQGITSCFIKPKPIKCSEISPDISVIDYPQLRLPQWTHGWDDWFFYEAPIADANYLRYMAKVEDPMEYVPPLLGVDNGRWKNTNEQLSKKPPEFGRAGTGDSTEPQVTPMPPPCGYLSLSGYSDTWNYGGLKWLIFEGVTCRGASRLTVSPGCKEVDYVHSAITQIGSTTFAVILVAAPENEDMLYSHYFRWAVDVYSKQVVRSANLSRG